MKCSRPCRVLLPCIPVVIVLACISALAAYETFGDITENPVVPGGLSPAEVEEYVEDGWVKLDTGQELSEVVIRFRRPEDNQLVWRIGSVPAGTEFIKNIVNGAVIIVEGANPVHPDSEYQFE